MAQMRPIIYIMNSSAVNKKCRLAKLQDLTSKKIIASQDILTFLALKTITYSFAKSCQMPSIKCSAYVVEAYNAMSFAYAKATANISNITSNLKFY